MNSLSKFLLVLLIIPYVCYSQPDPKYRAFDWVTYRQTGSINSITEGYQYIYIGTQSAGILRYHKYRESFDEPITEAQGLSSNKIQAVHFDECSGILWAATDNTIEYTYTLEGDWNEQDFFSYGIPDYSKILRIGSSENYIWVETISQFIKIDRVSGIGLGLFVIPTELDITWSSESNIFTEISESYWGYSVSEGWILNLNQFYDPYGIAENITTAYLGKSNDYWVGTHSGTIFSGDRQMETFTPLEFGLSNNDVMAIKGSKKHWIAGRLGRQTRGITLSDLNSINFDSYYFESTINMTSQSIYTIELQDDEIWFGTDMGILVYHQKSDYWRLYDQARLGINSIVISMAADSQSVWVGTQNNLIRVDKKSKRFNDPGFEDFFFGYFIYDLEWHQNRLWIATNRGIFIFDPAQNKLMDYKNFGKANEVKANLSIVRTVFDLESKDNKIYLGTRIGVFYYDSHQDQWGQSTESTLFFGDRIHCMKIEDEFLFIGTGDGFYRINLELSFVQEYKYPFIGQVNDMYISDDVIWLGTNKGLTKFIWPVD